MSTTTLPAPPASDEAKLARRYSRRAGLFAPELLKAALKQAFVMLRPDIQWKNPVMFVVEVGTVLTLLFTVARLFGYQSQSSIGYLIALDVWLFLTVLFANFATAIAEARGKAQADALRKTRRETPAYRLLDGGGIEESVSTVLQAGDRVVVEAGQIIPGDGEIIEGVASVDESAITGESAPVVREAGGDHSGVTGGTRVLSDRIIVRITAGAGKSFLDRMIALVEGAIRQRTPNEIALSLVLSAFTLIFLIVTAALWPMARNAELYMTQLLGRPGESVVSLGTDVPTLVALLVCLIPTTIGALLAAIGIAGMDRALRANIISKSGKAVEVAGDVDTLLLDKTGTITIGNRKATRFIPFGEYSATELGRMAALSSVADLTPEGKSIVELYRGQANVGQDSSPAIGPAGLESYPTKDVPTGARFVEFTAQTRMSGVDLPDGRRVRKGAPDAVLRHVQQGNGQVPAGVQEQVSAVASQGATPLLVCEGSRLAGLVVLEDILKPGMRDRFERLRRMGLRTVMVTGDNPLTAKAIAHEAGVDDYIAQATPEAKLAYIRKEQAAGKLVAMMGDGTNDAPALAQADVGVAMNSGTQAAKEAGNMVDLDSDPTKLIEVVEIGKQLLMTRGALTTFSIANDLAKYFAIVPALFAATLPWLKRFDIMNLHSATSAIMSAVIFNAIIIPLLIPIALRGVTYRPIGADALLRRNLLVWGLGGVLVPFFGIKIIDLVIADLLHLF
jgi:K+-transporting ATPase ATPase B chain